jgi:uncharacterized membrane protein
MPAISRLFFVLLLIVSPIVVYVTSSSLPARVATHFGSGGLANGWMSQGAYIVFMLVMITAFPLLVAAASGMIPAAARAMVRKKMASMDAGRQEEAVRWLGGHAPLIGVLLCLLFLGIHFLTLDANARNPARLDEAVFFVVLIAFVVLVLIWSVAFALRLRRP